MTDEDTLLQARNDMLAILDEKFASVPEWRAFRAMDKALAAMAPKTPSVSRNAPPPPAVRRRGRTPGVPSYAELALEAFEARGLPMPTPDIANLIIQKRGITTDLEKARVNIQSGLSRDKRIKSVDWLGGTAWWFADRRVPPRDSAGLGANH